MESFNGKASTGDATNVSTNLPDWSPSSIVPYYWGWKAADEDSGLQHFQLSNSGLVDIGLRGLQITSDEPRINSDSAFATPAADEGPIVQISICQANQIGRYWEESQMSCSRESFDRTSRHFGFPLEIFEQLQSRDGEVSMIHMMEHDALHESVPDLEEPRSSIFNVAFVDTAYTDIWCICILRHNIRTGAAAVLLILDSISNAVLPQQMQMFRKDILVNPLTLLWILQKEELACKGFERRWKDSARGCIWPTLQT